MNAFESGEQKVIPAVLVYAWEPSAKRVLLMHRVIRGAALDIHSGKWNGLGGKSEVGESPRQTARREFFEEAGIEIEVGRFSFLGCLFFPDFKAQKKQDWNVTVWGVELTPEEARTAEKFPSKEGHLSWVSPDTIAELEFWEGDRIFLPTVLSQLRDQRSAPFYGTFWYRDGRLEKHEFETARQRS